MIIQVSGKNQVLLWNVENKYDVFHVKINVDFGDRNSKEKSISDSARKDEKEHKDKKDKDYER